MSITFLKFSPRATEKPLYVIVNKSKTKKQKRNSNSFVDRFTIPVLLKNRKACADQHPLLYFERGKAKNYMHKETAEHLHYWLKLLAEKGRKTAFSTVKKEIRAKKEY